MDDGIHQGRKESRPLAEARQRVVDAIGTENCARFQAAWRNYEHTAEMWLSSLPDAEQNHARVDYLLSRAAIWREVGDIVRYLEEIWKVESYTIHEGRYDIAAKIAHDLRTATISGPYTAEFMQSARLYSHAIPFYLERDLDPRLTLREHGIINFRVAQCCHALFHNSSTGDYERTLHLLIKSLNNAVFYLQGLTEQTWALRLMAEVKEEGLIE